MRISLVTDGIYPFVVGGMQKHSFYLAKYLPLLGVEIDLYYFKTHEAEQSLQELFGDAYSAINFIELEFPLSDRLPLHYLRQSEEYSRRVLVEFGKRTPPDIIICKGFTAFEFIKLKKAGVKLPPVCVNFHGYEMFQQAFSLKEKLIQFFLRKPVRHLSSQADFVFSYGGKITEILKKKLGIGNNNILEFPSGIESRKIKNLSETSHEEVRFCFIGRNERRKGLVELNSAINKIDTKRKWTFDFIGPIPENLQLKKDNVRYHGLITNEENIFSIIRNCDVLVCPSWSEGMPNVILEAMASGLAILATDTGATSLLVNERTGWLIDKPAPDKLREIIIEIVNTEKAVIDSKRKNAQEHVREKFTWEKISKDLRSKLYEISSAAKLN